MFPGRARNIGWFRTTLALGILLLGLVCAGIGLVHNHLTTAGEPQSHHETQNGPQHIVVLQSPDRSPCNACFLQKLLSHGLLPAQSLWTTQGWSVKPPNRREGPELAAYCLDHASRGPPLV